MMFWDEYDELTESTKQTLTACLLRDFKHEVKYPYTRYGKTDEHLAACDEATATLTEGHDGFYGCDTGCEYFTLTGIISCPHGFTFEHDASSFGEINWVFDLKE